MCGDDGDPQAYEIGRQFRQAIIMVVRPSVFDSDVAAFNITGFVQAFAECCHEMCVQLGRTGAEKSDHWHRVLRARCQRHRRRATECRDEVPTPHVPPKAQGGSAYRVR